MLDHLIRSETLGTVLLESDPHTQFGCLPISAKGVVEVKVDRPDRAEVWAVFARDDERLDWALGGAGICVGDFFGDIAVRHLEILARLGRERRDKRKEVRGTHFLKAAAIAIGAHASLGFSQFDDSPPYFLPFSHLSSPLPLFPLISFLFPLPKGMGPPQLPIG
jgi:hypothetical protein